jgi:hypothetical protein
VNALGGEHVAADQRHQRRQRRRASANPVSEGRNAEIDALARKTLALPVQRLMIAELAKHHFGQQVRPGAAAGDRVEWGRRLGDRLAGTARELFTDRLDHLISARNRFQRFGDCLAELCQLAAATRAHCGTGQHDALARQMRRQRRTHRLGTRERAHVRRVRLRRRGGSLVFSGGGLEFLELHLQLVQQLSATLGGGTEAIAFHLGDQQLQVRHHRLGARRARLVFAAGRALGKQRRLQCVYVVWDGV